MSAELAAISDDMRAVGDQLAAIDILGRTRGALGVDLIQVVDDMAVDPFTYHPDGRLMTEVFDWPRDFVDRWYAGKMARMHPVFAQARFEIFPFIAYENRVWDEIEPLTFVQRRMKRDLQDVGIKAFIVAPIHLPFGRTAAIIWASYRDDNYDELVARNRHHLLAIGHSLMALRQPCYAPQIDQGDFALLTNRQIDCLQFAANGKTVSETAEILDLSVHTVREHLRTLADRLKATNTTHAVALASQFGLIAPLRS